MIFKNVITFFMENNYVFKIHNYLYLFMIKKLRRTTIFYLECIKLFRTFAITAQTKAPIARNTTKRCVIC